MKITTTALGMIACLNACSLFDAKSAGETRQPDINTGVPVQGPDNGQRHNANRLAEDSGTDEQGPASINQLVHDHENYEARLQKLENIVLLAGNNRPVASGNNYPVPATRASSPATAGQFTSRPIEPDVIARPIAKMATPETQRAPVAQDEPVTAQGITHPRSTSNTGMWAINLGSYSSKKTADRMLKKFHRQDIAAEQVTAVVNNRTMYRVRIPGFQTRRTAMAYAESLQERLGLTDVWIKKM